MKKPSLLTCPFCGQKARLRKHEACPPEIEAPYWSVSCSHETKRHYVKGDECPVSTFALGDTPQQAADKWNRRSC